MRSLGIVALAGALNLVFFLATLVHQGSASGQGPAPLLRGRALELVDERGQVRARLNVESDGRWSFGSSMTGAPLRVKLGANEEGSGLLLANDATEPGIHLLAKAAGSSMKVANKDGRERLIIP